MINSIIAAIIALFPSAVASETIQQLIIRSNAEYMSALRVVPVNVTPEIVKTFSRISKLDRSGKLIMLRVVNSPITAVTNGSSVVVDISLETMDQLERAFIIAHEFGHIALGHLDQKIALYQKHLPGPVTEHTANAANHIVGRELRILSHRVELEADAYALKTLVKLGWTRDQVVDMVANLQVSSDTPTHPSSAKRIRNLATVRL